MYSTGHASNDAETHPRNRASGAPPGGSGRTHGRAAQRNASSSADRQSQAAPVPYPRVYARSVFAYSPMFASLSVRTTHHALLAIVFRLSLLGSTFTLVWFVLVQILLYSSASVCRRASPHLWWLTFGVLSVMYVMILEVVVVAILVFVVGPILFVRYNYSASLGLG